jgi:DNA-binding MarR family transcriptional regulator
MTDTTRDPIAFQVLNEIGIIEQLARNRLERALPDDMKVAHFAVLNHLVRLGDGRQPAQLAEAFQVTRGAITNTLQRLVARGHVEVRPCPGDARAKEVYLTPEGRAARERAVRVIAVLVEQLGAELTEDELAALLPTLRRLRSALDRARD